MAVQLRGGVGVTVTSGTDIGGSFGGDGATRVSYGNFESPWITKRRAMPKVALAESMSDWETLIANASAHASDIPELGQKLEALRTVLEHAKATYARQQELEGERR